MAVLIVIMKMKRRRRRRMMLLEMVQGKEGGVGSVVEAENEGIHRDGLDG
jgi:hypothetical protein